MVSSRERVHARAAGSPFGGSRFGWWHGGEEISAGHVEDLPTSVAMRAFSARTRTFLPLAQ
jgi:hypothetical protein